MEDEKQFGGFAPPVSNFFKMPNEWINICAEISSLAELKVVQYVLRHTWGWREYDGNPKTITTDEFMHGRKRDDGTRMDNGTGLSNRSVIDGIRNAVEHGYLVAYKDDSDKARIEKAYALKMTDSEPDVKNLHTRNRCEESSQPDMKILHSGVKILHSDCEDSSHRSEKDTKERHSKKDTKERKKEPTAKSTEGSFSHSSTPQSSIKNSSLSSETKAEEETVILSPEEQRVYELGTQTLFKAKSPKITPTVKEHCGKIAKAGIDTLDKMESLIAFTKQEQKYLEGKALYLGNLVNALNGWLIAEKVARPAETLDMDAERERVRMKNEQQLELLRSRQRKRAEALAQSQGGRNG